MRKFFQASLISFSIYLGIVLSLSLLLINEKVYLYSLNSYFGLSSSLEIENYKWHPTNPSVQFKNLTLGKKGEILKAKEAELQFSLLNLISGNVIRSISLSNALIEYRSSREGQVYIPNIFSTFNFVSEINLTDIRIIEPNKKILAEINFNSVDTNRGKFLKAKFKDKNSNLLDLIIQPNPISAKKMSKGFLKGESFAVEKGLLNLFCNECNFDIFLDSQIEFNLLEDKLLNLTGNLKLKSTEKILGIESISTSLTLKDSDNLVLQLSSVLNNDESLSLPDFFLLLRDRRLFIPEFTIKERDAFNYIAQNLKPGLSWVGKLMNTSIDFSFNNNVIRSNFSELGIKNEVITLSGLHGEFRYTDGSGSLIIGAPLVDIKTHFLQENISLNNLVSEINFDTNKEKTEIYPAYFTTNLSGNRLEGSFTLVPNAIHGLGNMTLKLNAEELSLSSAFLLFPETLLLSSTKSMLKEIIQCGDFANLSLIYRGPIDGQWGLNSSSFSMEASGKDLCLELKGYEINKVNSNFYVNNFMVSGEIIEGNFLDSEVISDFNSYKHDEGYRLKIKGKVEGPFSTLTQLAFSNGENLVSEQGDHETEFEFDTPLSREINLLDEDSIFTVSSEARRGNLNFSDLGYDFKNIFFKADYDSLNGIKDGFVSLKLNSNPIVLEKNKDQNTIDLVSFSSIEKIRVQDFVPENYKNNLSGVSDTFIELNMPSLVRGKKIKPIKINIVSDLKGTQINLTEPFDKKAIEERRLQISFYPFYHSDNSRLQFKYGDLLRGKLNFYNPGIEGFLIAGQEKQSISIEEGKVSLIGNFKKFNFDLLRKIGLGNNDSSLILEIKNLTIDEFLISNHVFLDNTITSSNKKDYFEIEILNNQFGGTIGLPINQSDLVSINLNFLNLNFSKEGSNSLFLDIFNDLNLNLAFKTDSLTLNSHDYGNWSFNLLSGESSMVLNDLKGVYGKWGITKNQKGVSQLTLAREGLGWKSTLDSKIYSGSPEKAFIQIGIDPNFEMDTFSMETSLNWKSLPWEVGYDEILGEVNLDIEGLLIKNSEELQAENNFLRLINIFNITDSFEKVTNLDFRKLYKSGFSADSVKGSILITEDNLQLKNPLIFKSGSSEFSWKGKIMRHDEKFLDEIDLQIVMTLPLREYLPAYALLLGGPLTAGIVYIAGKAFERNIDQLSSGSWSVKGTLESPKTTFNGWFEDSKD